MDQMDGRTCNPPTSHIFLNGAYKCQCGSEDHSALEAVVTSESSALVRMFEALIGEAKG